jgi:predicted amidohydrolase
MAGMTIRAAAVQLNSTEDQAANRAAAEQLVREAARLGADLVVLPEKWPVLGHGSAIARAAQAVPDGPLGNWAMELAAELGIDLVAGSWLETRPGHEKLSNTSLHVAPDGSPRGIYRKLHLFDVEVDGRRYAESEHEEAGEEVVLSELAGGARLGMSICYDVRFPELYRELALRGAEILTVPSAFTLATTRDHWEVLLRARAIENQCYVVAANQIGEHVPGMRSGGRSMIVDPWGVVLACAPDAPGVVLAELDLRRLRDVRGRLPALAHRRNEGLYGRGRVAD